MSVCVYPQFDQEFESDKSGLYQGILDRMGDSSFLCGNSKKGDVDIFYQPVDYLLPELIERGEYRSCDVKEQIIVGYGQCWRDASRLFFTRFPTCLIETGFGRDKENGVWYRHNWLRECRTMKLLDPTPTPHTAYWGMVLNREETIPFLINFLGLDEYIRQGKALKHRLS